jgi:hypothetical protein
MKPRTILLIVGGLVVAACVCTAAFLALGAIVSNDPEAMARINATNTAEAIAAQTATVVAAATPTLPPGATLILDETFDSNDLNLNLREENTIQIRLQDGAYQAHFGTPGLEVSPIGQNLTDFIAELDCKPFSSKAICGVAFRLQPSPQQYVYPSYQVYLDGDYGFDVFPVDGPTFSFSNMSFAKNPGDWNHFRVEVVGAVAKLYLNNQFVDDFELNDSSLPSGDVALIVGMDSSAENADSADITVDNFRVWALP